MNSEENNYDSFIEEMGSIIKYDNYTNESKSSIDEFYNNIKDNSQFLCKKCNKSYLIEFQKNNLNIINYYCDCIKNSTENSYENSIKSSSNYTENSIIHYGKYKYYCVMCNKDMDDEQYNEHKHKHEHELKIIDFDKLNLKQDIRIINEILLNDEKNSIRNFKKMNTDDKLKKLIEIIINAIENDPNYNLIKNLKYIINFFKMTIYTRSELEEFINKAKKNKYIDNQIEDNKYKDSILEDIRIIDIKKSNLNNLKDCFCKELENNFTNLLELSLTINNINNIEPLLSVNLTNLEKLSFDLNKLDDRNIIYIKKLNLPNLKVFLLGNNNFTNYDIFEAIQHFEKLEEFDIDSNCFNDDIHKENLLNISLNSLKHLNLSNGVFNDKSIDLLFQLKLNNLEKLDLDRNNLNTLSFIKILSFITRSNWSNLSKICLNYNNINEEYESIDVKKIIEINEKAKKDSDRENEKYDLLKLSESRHKLIDIELKNNGMSNENCLTFINKYKENDIPLNLIIN